VSATQETLSGGIAALIGLVTLAVVAFDATWVVVRHVTVMAHEGAHAVAGSLLFRGVNGITINTKAEGGTRIGPGGSLGSIIIGFVGYIGPSVFGLGAAELIQLGHGAAVLWATLFLLVVLLTALSRSFGILTVILAGVVVFFVARYTPIQSQVVASYGITWLLLLSGVRRIIDIGLGSEDGKYLRGLTGIPHFLWSLLWLAGSVGAVILAARLLVMRA
jgi:Peptidase M50B-like